MPGVLLSVCRTNIDANLVSGMQCSYNVAQTEYILRRMSPFGIKGLANAWLTEICVPNAPLTMCYVKHLSKEWGSETALCGPVALFFVRHI